MALGMYTFSRSVKLIYPPKVKPRGEVQIEGYTFIAKSMASGQGGGVGVHISSYISFQRRMDLEQEDIECIWTEILFPKTKGFLVGIIYRPPDSSKHLCANFNCKFESMFSTVSAENKQCIFSSDINCHHLVSSDLIESKSSLTHFDLKQLISSPTRITRENKTLIDVICNNVPHNIFSSDNMRPLAYPLPSLTSLCPYVPVTETPLYHYYMRILDFLKRFTSSSY